MTDKKRFSKRFGYGAHEKEITIRDDAPQELREFVVQTIYDFEYSPSFLRRVICRALRRTPNPNNWSEYPNIEDEVNELVQTGEWYRIYDIIEAFYSSVDEKYRDRFTQELNDYFKQNGIGWKLKDGIIETRGAGHFEKSVAKVENVLDVAHLRTAQSEIMEAINDLSRRPKPDITGAIQHSLACLECVCREITGNKKATLGDLMKQNPGIVPSPLDQAISKMWGYASEQGRHLREGQEPDYLEAELIVEITATIATYFGKKFGGTDTP